MLVPRDAWGGQRHEGSASAAEKGFEMDFSHDILFGGMPDCAMLSDSVGTAKCVESIGNLFATSVAVQGSQGCVVFGFDLRFVLDKVLKKIRFSTEDV